MPPRRRTFRRRRTACRGGRPAKRLRRRPRAADGARVGRGDVTPGRASGTGRLSTRALRCGRGHPIRGRGLRQGKAARRAVGVGRCRGHCEAVADNAVLPGRAAIAGAGPGMGRRCGAVLGALGRGATFLASNRYRRSGHEAAHVRKTSRLWRRAPNPGSGRRHGTGFDRARRERDMVCSTPPKREAGRRRLPPPPLFALWGKSEPRERGKRQNVRSHRHAGNLCVFYRQCLLRRDIPGIATWWRLSSAP